MKYGQFCPIAKAAEVLCERWTLLIIREMLLGSTRYNQLQTALSKISPSLLSKRLTELEASGLIIKKKAVTGRSYEYHLTQAGNELGPIVTNIGVWGMQWARDHLDLTDQDVDLLMWDIRRRIDVDRVPGRTSVLKFHFTDLDEHSNWWIIINGEEADLCLDDPQKNVDLFFTTKLSTLIDVWMGDRSLSSAISSEELKLIGDNGFKNTVKDWFGLSLLSEHGNAFASN